MPFLWVTRAQLDARFDELRKELAEARGFEEEIKYEWALWFNKFRSLYAMLLKREKKAAEEPAGATEDGGEPQEPAVHPKRALRGF